MSKITKKNVIEKLRKHGVKATYDNSIWLIDRDFRIVGGIVYTKKREYPQHFIIDVDEIVFVDSFRAIKKRLK